MKFLLLLLCIYSVLTAQGLSLNETEKAWIKENPNVRFTGDPNWLPYEAFDENGNYIGIVADHLKLIEKRTGLHFIPTVVQNWSESLRIATEGKVSLISGDVADKVLNKNFNPIEPYLINPIIIIMHDHANYVEDLKVLKDKKVAIIKGYGYTADLLTHYPQMQFIEVENIQIGLRGVSEGKFDAILASNSLASYSLSEMGLDDIKIVGKTSVVMEVTLFVDKDQPILHDIINKSMQSISNKERNQIIHQWTNKPEYQDIDYILIWAVFTLGTIIVLILTYSYKNFHANKKHLLEMKNMETAQELGHMGSWEWNIATGELIWSDEVYRIFGEEPQSFPASYDGFKSYIPTEYHAGLEQAIDTAMKSHEPYEYDHPVKQKNGTLISVREAGYVRFNDDGEPVSMLGTVLDIDSVVRAKTAQRENEELTDLLKKFDENVIASNTDLHGNITYASQAFCKISGYSHDELINQPQNIVRHVDMPKEIYKELWRTIKLGNTWHGELKNTKKDGTVYWVDSTISPIYDHNKEVVGYSSIRRDITHEKQVEYLHNSLSVKSGELQRLNNTLERRIKEAVLESKKKDHLMAQQSKLASMGEMIGNIAHQWRQPLNALALLLQKQQMFFERGLLTSEKLQETVNKGTTLINKMSTTIDDFRDFFKPNKEKIHFDIKNAIEDTLEIIDASLYNENIRLVLDVDEGYKIYGYKNEFSQVILNLINNAKDVFVEAKRDDG